MHDDQPIPRYPPFLSVPQKDHYYAAWLATSVAYSGCSRPQSSTGFTKTGHKKGIPYKRIYKKDLQLLSTKARKSCIIQQDFFRS